MMEKTAPRGRLAPTPSGRLHWGNLRSSLLAWLQIRKQKGTLVLRIEDVDRSRSREHLRDAILQDLSWLGLDWDEGPDVGGPYGPYLQSEREPLYQAELERLGGYACDCSRAQLKKDRQAGLTPVCVRCRQRDQTPGTSGSHWRWALPGPCPPFVDLGYGEQGGAATSSETSSETASDLVPDDPILRGSDGQYRYTFAVVVDDHHMKIDQVCRGADLLGDTTRQIQLAMALYGQTPSFFHVPLVLDPDGNKLSKSEGAPDLRELRNQGAAPSSLIAALAQSCGLIPSDRTQITPKELLSEFELSDLYAVSKRGDTLAKEIS